MSISQQWDVLVIGAGPAGACAAIACRLRGLRTLLVDRARFPRDKVCGGCLSPMGVHALRSVRAALGDAGDPLDTALARGVPLSRLRILTPHARIDLTLARGLGLVRRDLDAALVRSATLLGVCLREGVSASCEPGPRDIIEGRRIVHVGDQVHAARCVIACDGLGGQSTRGVLPPARVARGSRIGLGTLIAEGDGHAIVPEGDVLMMVGRAGYIGIARLADGAIDVACALDPALVRDAGGPAGAAYALVTQARGEPGLRDVLARAAWRGTAPLTAARPRLEAPGLIVAGDCAGYVEPFTGEGMTWAMRAGLRAGQHAARVCAGDYRAGEWTRAWRALARWPHARCRLVSAALRRPVLLAALGIACSWRGVPRALARAGGPWGGPGSSGPGPGVAPA